MSTHKFRVHVVNDKDEKWVVEVMATSPKQARETVESDLDVRVTKIKLAAGEQRERES